MNFPHSKEMVLNCALRKMLSKKDGYIDFLNLKLSNRSKQETLLKQDVLKCQ